MRQKHGEQSGDYIHQSTLSPAKTSAQGAEKIKAEPKTPHFLV